MHPSRSGSLRRSALFIHCSLDFGIPLLVGSYGGCGKITAQSASVGPRVPRRMHGGGATGRGLLFGSLGGAPTSILVLERQ